MIIAPPFMSPTRLVLIPEMVMRSPEYRKNAFMKRLVARRAMERVKQRPTTR